MTPLARAAKAGDASAARFLIAKGADVNAKREDGMSALGLALKSGDAGIAQMLREHGARE
jgi:ankyrin repeat protein